MPKHILALIAAMGVLFTVTACNTMQGMGKDVEAGGDAIEDSAKKNKSY